MNCLLVMKIKWSLDINTGAVEPALQWGVPYADSDAHIHVNIGTRMPIFT